MNFHRLSAFNVFDEFDCIQSDDPPVLGRVDDTLCNDKSIQREAGCSKQSIMYGRYWLAVIDGISGIRCVLLVAVRVAAIAYNA